jgi:hypothetical protein
MTAVYWYRQRRPVHDNYLAAARLQQSEYFKQAFRRLMISCSMFILGGSGMFAASALVPQDCSAVGAPLFTRPGTWGNRRGKSSWVAR